MAGQWDGLLDRLKANAPTPSAAGVVRKGHVLLVDGDAAAYSYGGREGASAGESRFKLLNFLERAQRAAGAERTILLLTATGSNKGYRYAIARAKPYQGQRQSGRKPPHWGYLRELMEQGLPGYESVLTAEAEADDLFAYYAEELGYRNVTHLTGDKDMRMVPGYHMLWTETSMIRFNDPGEWRTSAWDKTWGHGWFWQQMLEGDNADYIPGLPWRVKRPGTTERCGQVTATKLLAPCTDNRSALAVIMGEYERYYNEHLKGQDALTQVLEQACLLWMRKVPTDYLDVCAPGNPLELFPSLPGAQAAIKEIHNRVKEAQSYGAAEAQAVGGQGLEGSEAGGAGETLRAVPAPDPLW